MNELIDAAMAWPVIIQGMLGSALFWLFLVGAERIAKFTSEKYSHHSKSARISWLISRGAKLKANACQTDEEFSVYAAVMMYRASRYMFKALMWITMGLALQTIVEPFGFIGFIGGIYYLLKGYEIIGPHKNNDDINKLIQENYEELDRLENK